MKIALIVVLVIAMTFVNVAFNMPVLMMFVVNFAFFIPIGYLINQIKKEKREG